MEGLGEVGFWLAVGMVITAWILSSGQKERERERQKQETLRALLAAEGAKDPTQILAYLRERDAAEQKRDADVWVAMNDAGRKLLRILAALVAAAAAFLVTVRVFNGHGVQPQSWQALVVLLAPFVTASIAAFLVYVLIRGKKNVPPPGA
jgi:hypothetical protein